MRVGDRVRVRRQRWEVVEIRPYGECQVLTLAGIGALNLGVRRRVIAPFDLLEPLERQARLRLVGRRRWRRACRALLADHGSAAKLQTACRAHIDLLPHQLEPAIAMVRGLGSRALIADEVGLGKTIQAGLVISELQARGAAERILVLTPAGLREQWAGELADRFGVGATVVDMCEARRQAARLPVGVNPWITIPVAVASFDYVKRPEVLPAVKSCRWDVVVVDEAHGITPASDRRRAVARLCELATYVLLLTATPHNGDRAAFESLCDLGALGNDRLLVFRRSRCEVALGKGRHIHRLSVRPSAPELLMHAELAAFTSAVRNEGRDDDREVWLALITLHKRSLSSARSMELSVARRLSLLPGESADPIRQLALPLDDEGGELDSNDEPPTWTSAALGDLAIERRLLERLEETARAAAAHETKLAALNRLLARLHKLNEPAIVFTEYRDTLLHVRHRLRLDCAVLHGGLTREDRRAELESFSGGRRTILLATDAAGEGLNLHHTCRVVVNLELPWNPMRLEQRIGRVDRIGQRRRVHAFHLIARDTGEARILDHLKTKIARAREDIPTTDPLGSAEGDGEEAIARLVFAGTELREEDVPRSSFGVLRSSERRTEDQEQRTSGDGGGSSGGCAVLVRLTDEAALEHARLTLARAYVGGDDSRVIADAGVGAVAAFARRHVRRQLGGRVLVVLQAGFEDTCGRVVATHLTALLVETSRHFARSGVRRVLSELLRSLERLAVDLTDPASASWQKETLRVHSAFEATRFQRERHIALARTSGTQELFQAGLFDARAARARADVASHEDEINEQAEQRRAASRSGPLRPTAMRPVLVLLP